MAKSKKYVITILILLFFIILYSHVIGLKKKNDKIEILQAKNPNGSKIQDLLQEKSPIIFKDVLYEWEPVINIFDKPITEINKIVKSDDSFNKDLRNCLNNYSMFLSFGWDYHIFEKTIDDIDDHFILENQHRHLICQIMGTQRYYLISPNQSRFIKSKNKDLNNIIYNEIDESDVEKKEKLKKIYSKNPIESIVNFWNEKETDITPFNNIEYIEIILREGNILHIPHGWWFLSQVEEDTLVLESFNLSAISLFI
jgi:hypothetical protein